MKVFINFCGVIDHLDILDEEASKSGALKECVQSINCQMTGSNYDLTLQLQDLVNAIDSLQRNIHGRKKLLLDIVDDLKRVNMSNKSRITEIESTINELSRKE